MYTQMLRRFVSDRPARHTNTRRHLGVESLEGRQLLSVGSLGPQFEVDSGSVALRTSDVTAWSTNGSSVVAWTEEVRIDNGEAYEPEAIRAQMFNSAGHKTGPVLTIVEQSGITEEQLSVAMDNFGDFVVSWTQEEPNGHTNILAETFTSSGNADSGIVEVADGTFNQTNSSVAMSGEGVFVVAYDRDTHNNNPDVFAKKYYFSGIPLGVITVADSSRAESNPSIAMDFEGNFDIAYQVQNGSKSDVFVARYNLNNALLGVTSITAGSNSDDLPSIGMDAGDGAVVAFRQATSNRNSDDIEAVRMTAAGVAEPEIFIASNVNAIYGYNGSTTGPSVADQPNGDFFAVAYAQEASLDVTVVLVNTVIQNDTLVSNTIASAPSITSTGSNGYQVTYDSADTEAGGSLLINNVIGAFGTY